VEFVRSALLEKNMTANKSVVLDADALNALATIPQWWQRLKGNAILTPHPGEMARLTKADLEEVQQNRLESARGAAAWWKQVVVLKGAYTIVAAPDGRAKINPCASAALASAGTGDVLAGIIAGLAAQGLDTFDAAACGVYLHCRAAQTAAAIMGDSGILAGDLLPLLPKVIHTIKHPEEDR
jgi:NAD(P)H-hydrate epimerase